MSIGVREETSNVTEFLASINHAGWTWFYKRLSLNETGATGTHQRAITIPRGIARSLFPDLSIGVNPDQPLPFELVSHRRSCPSARVIHWNQGTRDEYHVSNLGGRSNPILSPAAAGHLFVLAIPKPADGAAQAWLATVQAEEDEIQRIVGNVTVKAGDVHRPGGIQPAGALSKVDDGSSSAQGRGMAAFRSIGEEVTEPDPTGTAEAFSQSGYRFELAIADLIDNSVDAKASNVLVRFVTDPRAIQRIVVADDGHGMTEPQLRQAMQYGARIERHAGDLGKYGVGMKSASLSQCRSLSVLSRQSGITSGRRWTEQSIKSGWLCEVLDPAEASRMLDLPWGSLKTESSGTLVLWDGLDRLRSERDGVERSVDGMFRLLNRHLGLIFHRFLSGGRLRIHIDRVDAETWDAGLPATVEGLDPFDYPTSGATGFPKDYTLDLGDGLDVPVRAHVWPAKSKLAGYRLGGGRVASRQGLYFYRNDRLIQAGGWNGWRENDSEPHLSLARVAVDLPVEADRAFGLSLHKSTIDVPPTFAAALDAAEALDGSSFHDFVAAALSAYRSGNAAPVDRDATPIPGSGIPSAIRSSSRRILADRDPNVRPFRFIWAPLPQDVVVDLDRDSDTIRLNSIYRRTLLEGRRASSNDAPVFKLLLFVALRAHLGRERSSAPLRRELVAINEMLRAGLEAVGVRD